MTITYEGRGGFVFLASNGEFYAVNRDGEQSPGFTSERDAITYLHDAGSASLFIACALAGLVPAVLAAWFVALFLGSIAGTVQP